MDTDAQAGTGDQPDRAPLTDGEKTGTELLFGLRGGGRAEQAERERDNGWAELDRVSRREWLAGRAPAV